MNKSGRTLEVLSLTSARSAFLPIIRHARTLLGMSLHKASQIDPDPQVENTLNRCESSLF